jgi:hypothetical protein
MYGTGAKCCKTAEEAAKDPTYDNLVIGEKGGGTSDSNYTVDCAIDDNKWHMITLTTNKDGPGWRLLIDAVVRAQNPNDHNSYVDGSAPNPEQDHIYGGSPIDPDSTINFCGRDQWTGWHEKRYFLGRIAHIAIVADGLSTPEVEDLFHAYEEQFDFDIDPSCTHYSRTARTTEAPAASEANEKTSGALMIVTLTMAHAFFA